MKVRPILMMLFLLSLGSSAFSQTINHNQPSDPSLIKGKGTLSFKLNGKIYQSHPAQTKCWTSSKVPMTLLWAKGEMSNISWQLQQVKNRGRYRIGKDSSGMVNFTVNNKSYWIRTIGNNYLNITITNVKEVYNVMLLSGTFEGILEDKEGNKVIITEGQFTTEDI